MNTKEWALIAYTILTQMSVGAFVVLGLAHTYALRKAGEKQANALSNRALLAIGPVLVLATLASLFHLGNPTNAYRAISNIGSSWLSREILLTLLFIGAGGVFAIMQWRQIGEFRVRQAIAVVAAIIGLGLVFSMAQVYQLRAEPAWDTAATPVLFFTTAFLLGALAVGVAFVATYTYLKSRVSSDELGQLSDLLRDTLRWIAVGSIVLLGVELVIIPLYVSTLATGGPTAIASVDKMIGDYGVVFALRLILGFIGAGLFGLFLYRSAVLNRQNVMITAVYAAFALVLVAEVLGRFLFYASQARIGL
ncbi:MAG: dimethyl sulfoxide reductase anchor subunit [Chloroflexi bacterium]|nr:dimethyl sulfoxide reductase anchor subunit [Chloroflexota bacterium]